MWQDEKKRKGKILFFQNQHSSTELNCNAIFTERFSSFIHRKVIKKKAKLEVDKRANKCERHPKG